MLPISFFVNRKLKATHETSEGTYQFFFSFGDIRKQKQNKTKQKNQASLSTKAVSLAPLRLHRLLFLHKSDSFGNAAHTSQITPVEFVSQTAA